MKKIYVSICLLGVSAFGSLQAQTCWSAGTGADGAYSATSNTTLVGGTYNFTTFNINAGDTVMVTGTQPLIIHCTGAVTIDGRLDAAGGAGADGVTYTASGIGGVGVAGGANGGDGSFSSPTGPLDGVDGVGAGSLGTHGAGWSGGGGAGYATAGDSSGNSLGGFGGATYGTTYILGGEAGSGGGGGSGGYDCGAGGGGAGGGYISIQSMVSITIGATGVITCNGGNGGSDGTGNCGGGGGGSGGSIWLASPTITNNGMITANGGIGGASMVPGNPYYGTGANGSVGRIRLDLNGSLLGSGTMTPASNDLAILVVNPVVIDETCFGDMNASIDANATGNGPLSYAWAPSGNTAIISGLATGAYSVTVTDQLGCTTTATATVTEPTALSLTIVGVDETTAAANDGSATATGNGGTPSYTYSWMPSGGNSATATGLDAGTYTCTLTDANGCTTTQTVTIGTMSGIETANGNANVSIFPNPSNGPVQLLVEMKDAAVVRAEVYNTLGEIVLTKTFGSTTSLNETLDLSALPSGMYSIRVTVGENQVSSNVILQR